MNILIVGHGGREHAIAKRLAEEGNAIFSFQKKPNIGLNHVCKSAVLSRNYNIKSVIKAAKQFEVSLIIPSNEMPILNGITDLAEKEGIPCYAPSLSAARLEGDKMFSKNIVGEKFPGMVATAIKVRSAREARGAIRKLGEGPWVIKAGNSQDNDIEIIERSKPLIAEQRLKQKLMRYGEAIVEEYVEGNCGNQFNLYCLTDGPHLRFLPVIRDYPFKFVGRKEKTGGMGSISGKGLEIGKKELQIAKKCIRAAILNLRDRGIPYKGVLVGQFIGHNTNLHFNEFDARPGDPETINMLYSIKTPLSKIVTETIYGNLHKIKTSNTAIVCIYHVPPSYPNKSVPLFFSLPKGWLDNNSVFFGDSVLHGHTVATGSSRTLVVVGRGKSISEAREGALALSKKLNGSLFYRKDIGKL